MTSFEVVERVPRAHRYGIKMMLVEKCVSTLYLYRVSLTRASAYRTCLVAIFRYSYAFKFQRLKRDTIIQRERKSERERERGRDSSLFIIMLFSL